MEPPSGFEHGTPGLGINALFAKLDVVFQDITMNAAVYILEFEHVIEK